MSAYEELVERCGRAARAHHISQCPFTSMVEDEVLDSYWRGNIISVLDEVLRTLEAVTPDMMEAHGLKTGRGDFPAMLRASPLAPPAGAP